MGKSKFPGKPSKLVNKKRVSVLNSVANNPFCDNSAEDDGDPVSSSESETTKTFDGHGTQVINKKKNIKRKNFRLEIVEHFVECFENGLPIRLGVQFNGVFR